MLRLFKHLPICLGRLAIHNGRILLPVALEENIIGVDRAVNNNTFEAKMQSPHSTQTTHSAEPGSTSSSTADAPTLATSQLTVELEELSQEKTALLQQIVAFEEKTP